MQQLDLLGVDLSNAIRGNGAVAGTGLSSADMQPPLPPPTVVTRRDRRPDAHRRHACGR
jgi:hypothetical protein